jgi:LEA14-like dessication related protein
MKNPAHSSGLLFLLLTSLCLALAGCGGSAIRGEAPLVQTGGWRVDDGSLFLALRFRNVNDDPLTVQEISLALSVNDAPVHRHLASPGIDIAPGGFETVNLDLGDDDALLASFDRLAAGDVGSLAYRITGTVSTRHIGDQPLRLEGRVYPVPGRPGEFR